MAQSCFHPSTSTDCMRRSEHEPEYYHREGKNGQQKKNMKELFAAG